MNEYDAERSFNLIDHIFIDETLRDAELQGNLIMMRAKLNRVYDRDSSYGANDESLGNGPIEYTEQDEQGFAGLEAPLG